MEIISLFSGAGGMDIGFNEAGFNVIWANEIDSSAARTYINNTDTFLDRRDIREIPSREIPKCLGIIGGPPCQSWSIGGVSNGMEDERGRLFNSYIRIVREKQPLFFVVENVPGMLSRKHRYDYQKIIRELQNFGYHVTVHIMNAADYEVPQNRERLFILGIKKYLNIKVKESKPIIPRKTIREAIWDLKDTAIGVRTGGKGQCIVSNHEYLKRDFPEDYNKYDKVKDWDTQAYTVRANGKYMQIHPQAPHMVKTESGIWEFDKNSINLYRRYSVRECARLQTFPDTFKFYYDRIEDGYTMVGNAVPVRLAYHVGKAIRRAFEGGGIYENRNGNLET